MEHLGHLVVRQQREERRQVEPGRERIDQHGFVGEPPVAIARAAHALDGAAAVRVRQRELQPGVHQRRRLAGAGSADKQVPRQAIQPAGLARTAQRSQRLLETLRQQDRLDAVFVALAMFRLRRGSLRIGYDRPRQATLGQPQRQHLPAEPRRPRQQQDGDDDPARPAGRERLGTIERQQRRLEPDDQRQQQYAKQREAGRPDQPAQQAFHRAPAAEGVSTMMTTRRLRARLAGESLRTSGSVSPRPSTL